MSPEVLIIIFLSSLLLILLIIQFFFSNSGSRERIKILLEKQENLEKSIYQIFDEKFEKIDNKFQKSSAENSSSLFQIKEKISIEFVQPELDREYYRYNIPPWRVRCPECSS